MSDTYIICEDCMFSDLLPECAKLVRMAADGHGGGRAECPLKDKWPVLPSLVAHKVTDPVVFSPPPRPRMMWIRGDAGDALVNVDRISVIWLSKSNPDHGTLYMEDVASPVRVSLEDVKRIESMCDVLEEAGDA